MKCKHKLARGIVESRIHCCRPVQNVIEGHGGYNNATYPPSADIRVVDGRGGAVSQTQLGDELELQIFVSPPYSKSSFV